MSRVFKIFLILPLLLLVGCFKKSAEDIVGDLEKKLESVESYKMQGQMSVVSGANTFEYDVETSYEDDELYKVSLTNKNTNQQQIILKNKDGVYVLTPALNKSFKFQSEWPYNNSQAYLYQSIISDIVNDKDRKLEIQDDKYIFETTANYPNNKNITKQQIILDKKLKPIEVIVFDENDQAVITVKYEAVDFNTKFDDDYFSLEENMTAARANDTYTEPVYEPISDTLYPLYLPLNTTLKKESIIDDESGQRIILEFDGDNPFTLVQEKTVASQDFSLISLHGEPALLSSGIGVLTENSITWMVNGIELYVVSNSLTEEELYNIAESIGVFQFNK